MKTLHDPEKSFRRPLMRSFHFFFSRIIFFGGLLSLNGAG